MPPSIGCDKTLDTSPGTVTSTLYPDDYPNDERCNTTITAPEGQHVVLLIEDFEVEEDEASCPSNWDSLSVDDGELVGVYCGGDIPSEFKSKGRTLKLFFESDGSVTRKGFSASYYFGLGISSYLRIICVIILSNAMKI